MAWLEFWLPGAWEVTGSGDLTVGVADLQASSAEQFTGIGDETVAVAALSGTGLQTFVGAAAEAPAVAGLDAAALEQFIADGGVVFATDDEALVGSELFSGAVAFAVSDLGLVAAGGESFAATGAETFAVVDLLGTGQQEFLANRLDPVDTVARGLGAPDALGIVVGVPAFGGGEAPTISGSADLVAAVPTLDSAGSTQSGDVPQPGAGAWVLSLAPLPVAVLQRVRGRGQVLAPRARLDGVGAIVQPVTGAGDMVLRVAAATAEGNLAPASIPAIDGAATVRARPIALVGRGSAVQPIRGAARVRMVHLAVSVEVHQRPELWEEDDVLLGLITEDELIAA